MTDPVAHHGEGPVWSPSWGGLRWLDMLAGDVLSLAHDGSVRRRHVAKVVACLRPRARGGAVFGIERGFALEEPDGTISELPEVWTDSRVRMNDGGCDPDGRFYCGSMAYEATPGAGALYRLNADRSVDVVLGDVTISNGLEWSPDGTRAYYNDTASGRIDVFDWDRGSGLTARREFARTPAPPDGLTIDADGGIWVALFGGSAVHRYTADGVLDALVELPVSQVTACTFGGAGLDELYVTTSRENLDPRAEPLAGSLFRVRPGVRGLPAREFAG